MEFERKEEAKRRKRAEEEARRKKEVRGKQCVPKGDGICNVM